MQYLRALFVTPTREEIGINLHRLDEMKCQ
jgi:hypothetical protein